MSTLHTSRSKSMYFDIIFYTSDKIIIYPIPPPPWSSSPYRGTKRMFVIFYTIIWDFLFAA